MRIAAVLVLVAACGNDSRVHHLPDAPCTPGAAPVMIVAPAAYACHDPFKSKVSITNNSCEPLEIQQITGTAMVTTGVCTPPGPATFVPLKTTVAVGQTTVVLDLTGNTFCCLAPACPTPLQCDEDFTFNVVTNAGTFSSVSTAHLSLDGCTVICP